MRRSLILFGLLGVILIAAFTVYAVEYSTWGKTKAALQDEGAGSLKKPSGYIFFEVTTPVDDESGEYIGDMWLVGTCSDNGCCPPNGLPGKGRVGTRPRDKAVIVNAPGIVMEMPFLADLECFDEPGQTLTCQGGGASLVIGPDPGRTQLYFKGKGKDDTSDITYRMNMDATIVSGEDWPRGDYAYTVSLDNFVLNQENGSKKQACQASLLDDVSATVRLVRYADGQ